MDNLACRFVRSVRQRLYGFIKVTFVFPGFKLPLAVKLVIFLFRMGKGQLSGVSG
jgi:hypothetical protein